MSLDWIVFENECLFWGEVCIYVFHFKEIDILASQAGGAGTSGGCLTWGPQQSSNGVSPLPLIPSSMYRKVYRHHWSFLPKSRQNNFESRWFECGIRHVTKYLGLSMRTLGRCIKIGRWEEYSLKKKTQTLHHRSGLTNGLIPVNFQVSKNF